MIQSTMENESIQERQHSCKWYFDEAKTVYDEIRDIDEISRIGQVTLSDSSVKQSRLDAMLSHLDKTLASKNFFPENSAALSKFEEKYRKLLGEGSDKNGTSFFPLFVLKMKPEGTTGNETAELFEKKKFEICKVLNAIDSIVSRLCSDNVDNTYRESQGSIVGAETILKWLYTSANQGEVVKQAYDRETVVFRQIVNWYKKQKNNLEKETDEEVWSGMQKENVQKLLESVFVVSTDKKVGTIECGWNDEKCKEHLLPAVKKALADTLDDVEDAYKKLNGFRRYAIRYEMATADMKKEENLNKLLSLAKAIQNFFLCVCVAYMRISNLQLPRAEFKGARLIYSNVSDSNFSNGDFRYADMSCAIAKKCDFSSATLSDAKADNADFTRSLFSYADLSGVDFSGATMNGVKMDAVDIGVYSIDQLISILDDGKRDNKEDKTFKPEWENERDRVLGELKNLRQDAAQRKEIKFFEEFNSLFDDKEEESKFLHADSVTKFFKRYQEAYVAPMEKTWKVLSIDSGTHEQMRKNLVSPNKMRQLIKLRETGLKDSVLTNLNMSLIDMKMASFNDSDLSGCALAYSQAEGTDFSGANLTSAQAYRAHFENATFRKALLFNTSFVDCHMDSVNFSEANLTNAKIINTNGSSKNDTQNYIKKTIENKDVEGVKGLPQVGDAPDPQNDETINRYNTFFNVTASKITIAGCDLSRSTFEEAKFRSSILFDIDATSTIWDDADLMYSLLLGVVFNRSSMRRITLQEAKIKACDFSCCNLSESRLLSSSIDKAVFYDSNLKKVNLSHTKIKNTVFRDSAVDEMNISYTTFTNCVFIGIDFASCIGSQNTTFENCKFIKCLDENGKVKAGQDGKGGQFLLINDNDLVGSKDRPNTFSTK